jgi:hypothetical protein
MLFFFARLLAHRAGSLSSANRESQKLSISMLPSFTLAAGMIKRFSAPAILLSIGLSLGSCTPFSGFVADHWPKWAGGMPNDVPPRPGAPGYDEFMAHQEGKDAAPTDSAAANAGAQAAPAAAAEKTRVEAAPSAERPPDVEGAGERGLY